MSENISDGEDFKITVSLSKKALAALDRLKETSGYGSRGRTIEEAVLTVDEMIAMSKQLFSQYTADVRKQGGAGEALKTSVLAWFVVVLTKLSRFTPLS